jgi:hypothetical protein
MTAKQYILELLAKHPEGLAGGTIERKLAEYTIYKPSCISRRCRELYKEGKIMKREDKGFVEYKLKILC